MKNYVFIDFRVTPLKDWLVEHEGHSVEQVIGTEDNKQFRFIKCEDCKEVYYNGKTYDKNKSENTVDFLE